MRAFLALACTALACGCADDSPARPISVVSVEPLAGIPQVLAAELFLETPQDSREPRFGQIAEYYDIQPMPGGPDETAVVVVPARIRGKLRDGGLSIVPLHGKRLDVSRNADGKRWLTSLALVRGSVSGQQITRMVTVDTGDKYDSTSWYYIFAPRPSTEGLTVESRVAQPDARITHSRKLLTGFQQFARVFTVGDCNRDREDDCLLLAGTGGQAILLSGNDLSTLGEFSIGGELGVAACSLPDLDGDGVQEVFAILGAPEPLGADGAPVDGKDASYFSHGYRVLSPGKLAVLIENRIVRPADELVWIQSAAPWGPNSTGRQQVALHVDRREGAGILVIDPLTGESLDSIETPGGIAPRYSRPAIGVLSGAGGRRWIAWSILAIGGRAPRLFAAELGVAGSTREIALPADGRRYAECLCTVPLGAGGRDGLAVTVGPSLDGLELPECSPVLFLDVARLFEKR